MRCRFGFVRVGLAFSMRGRPGFLLGRREVGRAELLAVELDFSDAHRGERLAVSENLLVLLLAFEVKNQDLVTAAGFQDFAAHHRTLAGADMTFLAGNGQHVVELDGVALTGGQLLNFDDISGSNSILLPSGAYHRVHNSLPFPFEELSTKGLR